MNLSDYIDKSTALDYHLELGWLRTILGKPVGESKYYKDGHYLLDGEPAIKSDGKVLCKPTDEITISELSCIDGNITTTVGKFIANVAIDMAYKGKLPFINKQFTPSDLSEILLADETLTEKEWVDGLERLTIAITMLTKLSPLVTKTTTPGLLEARPGTDAFRNKLRKEMIEKYGEDNFNTNSSVIAEYRGKLIEYDAEYVKKFKDEGYTLAMGKPANVSRPKYFLTSGEVTQLDGDSKLLDETLEGGMTLSPEAFALAVNDIRKGSSDRGSETQMAGVLADILGRATQAYIIDVDYCGTKDGQWLEPTNSRILNGYILKDGKPFGPITDISTLGTKPVLYMSPRYCKAKGLSYCTKCMGSAMSRSPYNISLAAASLGGLYLNILMKSTHDPSIKLVEIDQDDMFM